MNPKRNIELRALWVCALMMAVGGCASTDSKVRGREIAVRHAEIVSIERVAMPSAAPAGAIVGGFTGLILSRNKSTGTRVASGLGGAALGGLATRALEGDRRGYEYTLRYDNGDESRFVTEKGGLMVGDCVSVERGEYANVRRVDATKCAHTASPTVREYLEAEQCQEAKKLLLDATGKEAVEDAAKKVEVLCAF